MELAEYHASLVSNYTSGVTLVGHPRPPGACNVPCGPCLETRYSISVTLVDYLHAGGAAAKGEEGVS